MNEHRDEKWENRFEPSKMTLFIDSFMTGFIRFWGVAVILAVMGIFVFILSQIVPLFTGAEVTERDVLTVPPGDYIQMGVDEWTELPVLVEASGNLVFLNLHTQEVETISLEAVAEHPISAVTYKQDYQELVLGTEDGKFALCRIGYKPDFSGEERRIRHQAEVGDWYDLSDGDGAIIAIDYADSGEEKVAAAIQQVGERRQVSIVTLKQKVTLMGAGKIQLDERYELSDEFGGLPEQILVSGNSESVIVVADSGVISYFRREAEGFVQVQQFEPFSDTRLASVDFLFGDVSLVLTDEEGRNIIYSLYIPEGESQRLYGKTKEFADLPAGATFFSNSLRNKGFSIGSGSFVSLRYGTTAAVRWEKDIGYEIELAIMSSKYDSMLLLDAQSQLHVYDVSDHHPEAGVKAFFSKIWYEGYSEPGYHWQSTGGTDDFEPKLSMIPVVFGTLKGTFYAMFFALPIALLAALYTSQFQKPEWKSRVKPIMEVMASLPSVVLGFLGALWLAPLIEGRVPSVLLFVLLIPIVAVVLGTIWGRLPKRYKIWCPDGYEFFLFLPIVIATFWVSWQIGPVLERMLFVVQDPDTGRQVADFRLWWPQATGAENFDQRNALVVGFMMGFAVIPIIFTISEDALSNVPRELTSGSLALGASRWQTAVRVVLPTASAGIFSAVMIGLGRAVGETMIVLMATGNTPIMEMNIFNGFRTLSANIAVELPEAPQGGTLYRALFLGAFLLFMMTFFLNTLAEMLRQHLRNKYKTV